jgi:mannose-6-phosphate isomerase-like protein (cupin superfamily)
MNLKTAAVICSSLISLSVPVSSQAPERQPLVLPLDCVSGDCLLLHGEPQTAGMHSGLVRLKPGETVGWHTTGRHEEALVILHGTGEAQIEGRAGLPMGSQVLVYIPPETRHNVKNTGDAVLEYVYVVAPTSGR